VDDTGRRLKGSKSEDLPSQIFHYVAFGRKAGNDCLKNNLLSINPKVANGLQINHL
jgi:hypothetical protein